MTFKITSEKYIQIGSEVPDTQFIWFGWDWSVKWFLGVIPYIIYHKKLVK